MYILGYEIIKTRQRRVYIFNLISGTKVYSKYFTDVSVPITTYPAEIALENIPLRCTSVEFVDCR